MAGIGNILNLFTVKYHGYVNADGTNEKETENIGEQNPDGAVFQQLFPVAALHGKAHTHAGNHKEDGNPPNVDHAHENPQSLKGLLVLDKENVHGPGLEADHHVVHNQQAQGENPQPVNVIPSH